MSYYKNLYTLETIDDELRYLYENPALPKKQTELYIIRYKGKRLTMSSGKFVWKKESHAKAALRCHFEYRLIKYMYPPIEPYVDPATGKEHANFDYSKAEERKKEFIDKLMSMVEIVKIGTLDDEMLMDKL